MLQEMEKFFIGFVGDEYSTVIKAFLIGFCLMLVYGCLIRPILNLCVGKNKGFFDFIMIALILIVGVKVAFPALFVADGFTQDDLDSYYEQGYSDGKDYGEGIGYDKGYEDALKENGITSPEDTTAPDEDVPYPEIELRFNSEADLRTYLEEEMSYTVNTADYRDGFHTCAIIPYSTIQFDLVYSDCNNSSFDGSPYCVVNNVLYYIYDRTTFYDYYSSYDESFLSVGFFIYDTDGNSVSSGFVCTHSDDIPPLHNPDEPYENEDGLTVYSSIEQFVSYNEFTWESTITEASYFRGDALLNVETADFANYEDTTDQRRVTGTPYCIIEGTTYYLFTRDDIVLDMPTIILTNCRGYCTMPGLV